MSCMSAYSMPLWTILTKWPAPSVPRCAAHGVPSTTAAMLSTIGPRVSYASSEPPTMIDGPLRAPSSPPETPAPTKCSPLASSAWVRRIVSPKSALPPSTTMSPGSSSPATASTTASVPRPAWTMTTTQRGVVRLATNSSSSTLGTKSPSSPWASMRASVFSCVRFHRATVWPLRARFRARLLPMTASPITPTPARALMAPCLPQHGAAGRGRPEGGRAGARPAGPAQARSPACRYQSPPGSTGPRRSTAPAWTYTCTRAGAPSQAPSRGTTTRTYSEPAGSAGS